MDILDLLAVLGADPDAEQEPPDDEPGDGADEGSDDDDDGSENEAGTFGLVECGSEALTSTPQKVVFGLWHSPPPSSANNCKLGSP